MKSTALLICLAVGLVCLPLACSKSDEQGKDTTQAEPDASDKFIGKEAGQVRDDNGLKMKLVWCPPGKRTSPSRIWTPILKRNPQFGRAGVTIWPILTTSKLLP
jgi:hypothetical protein